MGEYADQTKNDKSHINTLRFVIGVLAILLMISGIVSTISLAEPEQQRISLPPELRFGAEITTGEIHAWEIYNFAGAVYQKINLWRKNGAKDYVQNIKSYRALITQNYLATKYDNYQYRLKRGELEKRTRFVAPLGSYAVDGGCGVYSDECVVSLGSGRWKVWIDVQIKEYQLSQRTDAPYEIQNIALRIPFLIVAEDDDPQYNPWGLKIDREYVEEIQQIDLDAEDERSEEKRKEDEKLRLEIEAEELRAEKKREAK